MSSLSGVGGSSGVSGRANSGTAHCRPAPGLSHNDNPHDRKRAGKAGRAADGPINQNSQEPTSTWCGAETPEEFTQDKWAAESWAMALQPAPLWQAETELSLRNKTVADAEDVAPEARNRWELRVVYWMLPGTADGGVGMEDAQGTATCHLIAAVNIWK
ncbi:UNVERIFIED_CONTAM: hypothetical protein K2H54_033606 [Gekko kuhli]